MILIGQILQKNFQISDKKQTVLNLSAFLNQFIVDTFLIKVAQFEEPASKGIILIPLAN